MFKRSNDRTKAYRRRKIRTADACRYSLFPGVGSSSHFTVLVKCVGLTPEMTPENYPYLILRINTIIARTKEIELAKITGRSFINMP